MSAVVHLNATHPRHQVDRSGARAGGLAILGARLFELRFLRRPVLGKAVLREGVQDGAMRMVIALACLHEFAHPQHAVPCDHMLGGFGEYGFAVLALGRDPDDSV